MRAMLITPRARASAVTAHGLVASQTHCGTRLFLSAYTTPTPRARIAPTRATLPILRRPSFRRTQTLLLLSRPPPCASANAAGVPPRLLAALLAPVAAPPFGDPPPVLSEPPSVPRDRFATFASALARRFYGKRGCGGGGDIRRDVGDVDDDSPGEDPRPVADLFPRRFRRLHQPRPPRRRGL